MTLTRKMAIPYKLCSVFTCFINCLNISTWARYANSNITISLKKTGLTNESVNNKELAAVNAVNEAADNGSRGDVKTCSTSDSVSSINDCSSSNNYINDDDGIIKITGCDCIWLFALGPSRNLKLHVCIVASPCRKSRGQQYYMEPAKMENLVTGRSSVGSTERPPSRSIDRPSSRNSDRSTGSSR